MPALLKPCFIALCCLLTALRVECEEIRGVVQVIDGDSLTISDTEIRLHGIDAPEGKQYCERNGRQWACGRSATRALQEITGRGDVYCQWRQRDTYGRALATCFKDGANINEKMVFIGMALAYRRYSDAYIAVEISAERNRRGLWASTFAAPWQWRIDHPRSSR